MLMHCEIFYEGFFLSPPNFLAKKFGRIVPQLFTRKKNYLKLDK